jgi:uncharacterized lipoprotein YddW (UPF0748 family)
MNTRQFANFKTEKTMRKQIHIIVCLLFLAQSNSLVSQITDSLMVDSLASTTTKVEEVFPPVREFRGIWIASVNNIDFPSSANLDADAQREEWIELLDYFQEMGFNTIIAQVRPAADAFYPSKLAPWSKFLSGRQGRSLEKGYDPLAFMLEETHKRGMEFHAWLNPLRASLDLNTKNLAKTHPFHTHPDWMVPYGGKYYFNPGIPEVRDYLTEVVGEILMTYDVDAIHFDDYFYPYKKQGEEFPDSVSFAQHGFGYFYVKDWRRSNVDKMIQSISTKIKALAPHVKFGISPFGVWRNQDMDPVNGSMTRAGITSYDDLHADILKWLENGWIDYVAPQLYWNIGFAPADYQVLLDWWSGRTFGRHLYIGHAAYKVGTDKQPEWSERDQIAKQIQLNRDSQLVSGSAFFNAKAVRKNPLGLADTLATYYENPALIPPMAYIEMPVPLAPIFTRVKRKKDGVKLKWEVLRKGQRPTYTIIYRFNSYKPENFEDGRNLLAVVPWTGEENYTFVDKTAKPGETYTYVLAMSNRVHVGSLLSNARTVK